MCKRNGIEKKVQHHTGREDSFIWQGLLEYACTVWEKALKEEVEKLTFTMNFQHNMEGETVSFFTIGQQLASCLGILGRSMLGLVNHAEDLFESS